MRFEDALRASGLLPQNIVADGKWRRCKTADKPHHKNGAYVLHHDGRGFWKNWAVDTDLNIWRDDAATVRPIDESRLKAQRDADRTRRIAAMRSARAYWAKAAPMRGLHPYIAAKGLTAQGCVGLRTHNGMLVVPVWFGGWIISVQTIAPDGQKRFWTAAPVKGGAYVLARPRGALTAVCEGLATGLAIYQSVRQASVIVAFDAGNLLPVIDRIRPSGSVVIVADNDHKTELRIGSNPGIDKARNAAELIGCGVTWPTDIEGSDVADALKEWGDGANRRVERLVLAGARYVSGAVP